MKNRAKMRKKEFTTDKLKSFKKTLDICFALWYYIRVSNEPRRRKTKNRSEKNVNIYAESGRNRTQMVCA